MTIAISNKNDLSKWIQNLQEFQLDSIFDTTILGRAYEYIPKVTLLSNQENKITCQIVSNSIYVVIIEKVGSSINASCNCPYNQKCKHMAAALLSLMSINWNEI